ncbi:alpha-amylase family protein [Cohnella sp. 56]|uniref:alpha-amylase family protein n=1 Tax=Cohnella sp. 56 TaxID=3113722 RepID=UPI0030E9F6EF
MFDRKNAFFGLHFDLHPVLEDTSLGADVTGTRVRELLLRIAPDYVQYDSKGHFGYAGYETAVGTPSPGIVRDALAIWREETRKLGIGLGVHYSGLYDYLAVRQHPEWARIGPEGEPDAEATSVFGPYVDELLVPQLVEIADRYDVDNVWLDGECWGAKLDYSPAALAAWKAETGWDDAPTDRGDNRWPQWKSFHRAAFERYLQHWTGELRRQRPEVQIASNWAYTTMCPIPVAAPIDIVSGDYDPMLSADRARTEARYLTNVGMPWELLSWGFDSADGQEELLKSPAQLKQEAGVVLMHGGGFMLYYLPTRSGYIADEIADTAADVAAFCRARQALCHRSVSVPQVALLHSAASQFDVSDRVYTWWDTPLQELEGALHALLESHYSVDVLTEYMLMERLDEFPLLVIPDSPVLEESFRERVLRYVEKGGKLLLLGERCARLFAEADDSRGEAGDGGPLGARLVGEPCEVRAQLVSGAGKIGCPGRWQAVEPLAAETLSLRYHGEGVQERSAYLDVRAEGVSSDHLALRHEAVAATLRRYGRGEIAAVYGPLADRYYHSHHPFMRRYIGDIVRRLFPAPEVTTDAPACVDLALRRSADGALCVNLLNLAGMPVSNRRGFPDYIPPIGPIQLSVAAAIKPTSVVWEPSGQPLDYEWRDGRVEFVVPELDIHGAAVIR